MSGNVWEWTRSLWEADGAYPYPCEASKAAGRERLDASEVERVLRGGASGINAFELRVAYRRKFHPNARRDDIGFRLVVSSHRS
jgi:formylglycine-generating enzyme required for sulfatase activity